MEPPSSPSESPPEPESSVAGLERRLGIALSDPVVALAALTHKSYVNEHRGEGLQDNERLEFLGDAVIDLAVSHRLMEQFPGAREGELSKIRAAVVDEAGLAQMARELDLGSLLRLGRGEELTGGRQKSSLLADAMEAVVAALYLGGGLPPVLALIDRFLGEAFARAAAGTLDRDYKTQFQELAQSRLRTSPRYRVVGERGPDHSKVFEVELELRGEVVGRGEGRSKKDAEQGAAKCALEAMNGRVAPGPTEDPGGEFSTAATAGASEAAPDEREGAPEMAHAAARPGPSPSSQPAAPDEGEVTLASAEGTPGSGDEASVSPDPAPDTAMTEHPPAPARRSPSRAKPASKRKPKPAAARRPARPGARKRDVKRKT